MTGGEGRVALVVEQGLRMPALVEDINNDKNEGGNIDGRDDDWG